eukprot:2589040-Pyramimonas_sp.AAC.1
MGQQLEMHTKCLGWLEEYQLLAHKHESHAEQLLVDLDQEKVKVKRLEHELSEARKRIKTLETELVG